MIILNTDQAAHYVGLGKSSLEKLRLTGGGPKFIKLGMRRVGYLQADLDEWLTSRPRVGSTSELGVIAPKQHLSPTASDSKGRANVDPA